MSASERTGSLHIDPKIREIASKYEVKVTRTVYARLIKACDGIVSRSGLFGFSERTVTTCGAPGTWQRIMSVRELARMSPENQAHYFRNRRMYPEVFVLPGDPRINQAIEDRCPCCGKHLPPVEDRGAVWRKVQ